MTGVGFASFGYGLAVKKMLDKTSVGEEPVTRLPVGQLPADLLPFGYGVGTW